jgi:hypothetical protein
MVEKTFIPQVMIAQFLIALLFKPQIQTNDSAVRMKAISGIVELGIANDQVLNALLNALKNDEYE